MDTLSDDDFDHVKDFDMSDMDSEAEEADNHVHDTPSTTPPRTQTPRPSQRKIIPCPYRDCTKTFNRNARLQEHIRSHTGERPFVCPHAFCAKAFLRDTHLKHHLTSAHSDVRKFECTWEGCDKRFATGQRLRRHGQSHEGREKYRCRGYDGCNETFRKHETLRKHVLSVHEKQKPFPCRHVNSDTGEACNKAFSAPDKLKAHERAMHDTSRFSCATCADNHAGGDVLMSVCDGPKPLSFATFTELQVHIAEAHPPQCSICSATFITNKELTRHKELDHGVLDPKKQDVKQFPCPHAGCGQIFTKHGNLTVHVKTVHEKKKDFVCGTTVVPVPEELEDQSEVDTSGCGQTFTCKASLVDHVRTAHFRLPSKRMLREERKRAKRFADDDMSVSSSVKRRMPQHSALARLAGTSAAVTPSTQPPSFGSRAIDDELMDEWNQLSGSMTMVGDHLYHNGKGYHLVSEDGSADQVKMDEGQYMVCRDPQPSTVDDIHLEPFFDFEHEQEHIHPNIDPILLQT